MVPNIRRSLICKISFTVYKDSRDFFRAKQVEEKRGKVLFIKKCLDPRHSNISFSHIHACTSYISTFSSIDTL